MKFLKEKKMFLIAGMTCFMTLGMTRAAYASSYTENFVKWGLNEAFWIVLGATFLVSIACMMRRATTGIVVTIIIGGLIAFGCKKPEIISTVGETIGNVIFGG